MKNPESPRSLARGRRGGSGGQIAPARNLLSRKPQRSACKRARAISRTYGCAQRARVFLSFTLYSDVTIFLSAPSRGLSPRRRLSARALPEFLAGRQTRPSSRQTPQRVRLCPLESTWWIYGGQLHSPARDSLASAIFPARFPWEMSRDMQAPRHAGCSDPIVRSRAGGRGPFVPVDRRSRRFRAFSGRPLARRAPCLTSLRAPVAGLPPPPPWSVLQFLLSSRL